MASRQGPGGPKVQGKQTPRHTTGTVGTLATLAFLTRGALAILAILGLKIVVRRTF